MRIVKWVGIVFACLAAAIVVVVLVWDWNWFKDRVAAAGSEATGRNFAIDGDISVDLGWTSSVRVEGIRLSNADWAKDPDMVRIAAVDFDIEISELLRGRVVLPHLRLTKPEIRLERADDGTANWEMAPSTGAAAVEATVPDDRTEFPVIGRLRIDDGTLGYAAPADQIALEARVATAIGEGGEGSEEVRLEGDGSFAKAPFKLRLRAGSLLALRESDRPYPIDLYAKIGRTTIKAVGTAADPLTLAGPDFRLSVEGADMADLFPIFRIPLPETPAYAISGHLVKPEDTWRFEDFKGKMGDSDLSGTLAYTPREKRPYIEANVVSERLDFADLAGFVGADPEADRKKPGKQEQRAKPAQRAKPGRVLPDMPVDLARLRAADMDVRFRGSRIRYPALPIDSLDVQVKLQDGRLTLEPLKFGIAKGSAAGNLVLDGRRDVPRVATNLTLRKLDLKRFFGGEHAAVTAGEFAGKINLTGSGKSVAEILGNADGLVVATMAGGRFSRLLVELSGIDVAEALPLFGSDDAVEIRCVVADFDAKNGTLQSRALVFDTTDTLVDAYATIDLKTEALNIKAMAHPKDPSPFAGRTPITVGGTFADPSVGIDPSGLIARGAAAVALGALLTPLAAIIPFVELGLGEDSDCGALLARAGRKAK